MSADFYSSYRAYKDYQSPSLTAKDIARFDAEIWNPGAFSTDMNCLEIGSGTGQFLAYLSKKGIGNFQGIDHDPALESVQPIEVASRFKCVDVWQYLETLNTATIDRIILLDVLEHFTPDEGFKLLSRSVKALGRQGKIIIKVPNASSPWGINYQFGDLTHKSAYTGESLRQLATACGLRVESIYDQRRGSRRRMVTDAIVHRFLSWALLTPPPRWGANLYCILSPL
ncbi:MAG: class I SAM-dependent methyltransferase [Rhodospirillaceae bacterium]|nr:class I SAM-dependent methyltransferase [Rhodospirillaceae bacterium]MBL6931350.1 class I SAM-dependent methyltransferase [Rhodospirillales bacterium]